MKKIIRIMAGLALIIASFNGQAQISIGSLSTFGGDGWLANGENTFLEIDV